MPLSRYAVPQAWHIKAVGPPDSGPSPLPPGIRHSGQRQLLPVIMAPSRMPTRTPTHTPFSPIMP